jgi:hypothetical protein
MEEKVIIEWTYTPENYLKYEVDKASNTYTIKICDGKARAIFPASIYDRNNVSIKAIHDDIKAYFTSAQVLKRGAFHLSEYTLRRQYPDGTESITIPFYEQLAIADSIEFITADIIREEKEFMELSAKHCTTDPTARRILLSYSKSVDDPANELVHLYEIIDALCKKFSGEDNARKSLNISRQDWKRLRTLCNSFPLMQGRHRGQHIDGLRDATAEELATARDIAQRMIFAYLRYIDKAE